MTDIPMFFLNFYLDDEGQKENEFVCRLDLQGGLSDDTEVYDSCLDSNEVQLIEALLIWSPDTARTLLNHLVDAAYQLGLQQGRCEKSLVVAEDQSDLNLEFRRHTTLTTDKSDVAMQLPDDGFYDYHPKGSSPNYPDHDSQSLSDYMADRTGQTTPAVIGSLDDPNPRN